MNRKRKPSVPKVSAWLLKQILPFADSQYLIGDFEEEYLELLEEKGPIHARCWYWFQILKTAPDFIKNNIRGNLTMLKNYIKLALRNFKRHKSYSFINVMGLATGMTCFILIMLWVQDELSYDRFHEDADNLYRVVQGQKNDPSHSNVAVTPAPLAERIKNDNPEIKNATRYKNIGRYLISYGEKQFFENDIIGVDPEFFEIFSFALTKGDAASVFDDRHSVVLTMTMANKYFGDEDPIGKLLTLNNFVDLTVTGVIEDTPRNTHLTYNFLMPFQIIEQDFGWNVEWNNNFYYTYIRLFEGASAHDLEDKIKGIPKEIYAGAKSQLFLQRVVDIHLHSDFRIDLNGASESSAAYIYIFSVVAVFILLIACINFMNLTTARSSSRAKEVGLRKVVGAFKTNLINQFLGETMLMSFCALMISAGIVYLVLPTFNDIASKQLSLSALVTLKAIGGLFSIALLTGLISGSYPAFFLSALSPAGVMKGSSGSGSKGGTLRKVLVITQFTLSITLIIGTNVVYDQLNFIQDKNLGIDKDHLVYLDINNPKINTNVATLKERILQHPDILGATVTSDIPTYTVHSTSNMDWESKDPNESSLIHHYAVDYDFVRTLGIQIIQGRNFSPDFPADKSSGGYILNETAVELTGLKNPVGKFFSQYGNPGRIIGIAKDFHFKSLHRNVEPLVLRMADGWAKHLLIKLDGNNIAGAIDHIENSHKNIINGYPFEFTFLDEEYDRLYRSEQTIGTVFDYFTFLAIFISCLGLFGLVSYMQEQRTKEFGIRKILGAKFSTIVTLFSREVVKWIIISNVLSWPIAFYAMNTWLQGFAYRTDIAMWIYIKAGLMALFITVMTISYHSVKAATSNPVKALRYE